MILADLDSPEVAVWQLAESCGYTADLPVWTELTAGQGPVLDLGCGIGRVARHLARSGTEVVGLDFNLDDQNTATSQTAAVLQRVPDLAGVFGTNVFSAQGAGTAVVNAGLGGQVQVVAYDATQFAIEMLTMH